MNKKMGTRLIRYFIGLFIMTVGISISVKSNLGVAPVSSIPYTMTCVWGIEMGKATIIFHTALVLLQIICLRRRFKIKNLLQIGAGVIFGYFTTFCNLCVSYFPDTESITLRIAMMIMSSVFIAAGIFLYMPANIMPLAAEGAIQAISETAAVPFARIKIIFDCTMVAVSLIVCLTVLHSAGSVGIGTVGAAVLVGVFLGMITKRFGKAE